MAADGRIQIDIDVNNNNAVRSVNGLNDSANGAGKSFLSLGKIIAGVGAVILSAKLINSVKDFTVEAVKASAAAQALNSQFSQVFGNLEADATLSLKKIAAETNILPERLKGSFVQIAAFAKTAGFDNAAALELSSRATLAAADSAAFYDKSISEVTESLQSYLKGNFANDAALGISSTETTRNAKANELYGKSFKDLSEAQKQLTLLAQVEDGNKLSGALGQAAREGTGLENVTGNLTQAWENFKVAIGDNFLDLAVNGIILLTNAIQKIDVARISQAIQTVVSTLTNIATAIIPVVIQGFEFLRAAISQAIEYVLPLIDRLRAMFEDNSGRIREVITEVFGKVKEVIETVVSEVISFVGPQLDKLKQFWAENGEQILLAVQNAFNAIKAVIDFVMPAIKLVIDIVWNAIKDVITGALDIILGAVKVFSGIFTGDFSKVWEGIKQIFSGAIDFILGIMTLSFFGGIRTILVNLSKAGVQLIKGLWDDALKLFQNFANASTTSISGVVGKIIEFFRQLALNVVTALIDLKTSALKLLDDVSTGIIDAFKALPDKFLQIGKDIIQGLINGFNALNPVKAITTLAENVVEGTKNFFGIRSPSRVFAEIGGFISEGLAVGIDKVAPKAVKSVQELANATIVQARKKIEDEYNLEVLAIKNDKSLKAEQKNQNLKALFDKRDVDKDLLDSISNTVKRRKELGDLSVKEESIIWQQTLGALKSGSDEYLSAQKSYQDTLKNLRTELTNTNEQYKNKILDVNEQLKKSEQSVADTYEKEYNRIYNSLSSFKGTFQELKFDSTNTGKGLIQNLSDQVEAFKIWEGQINRLTEKAIDKGLLAELQAAGPQALQQLIALNGLTDAQLTQYSDLYAEKSKLAREATNKQLEQLSIDSANQVTVLRENANKQLTQLQTEWLGKIENIVNGTGEGFTSMEQIGKDAGNNLLSGLSSVESSLVAKATSIANAVQAALASTLNVPTISGPNLSGIAAPSSAASVAVPTTTKATTPAKTQINNITVQTNNQKTQMERIIRQNTFAF